MTVLHRVAGRKEKEEKGRRRPEEEELSPVCAREAPVLEQEELDPSLRRELSPEAFEVWILTHVGKDDYVVLCMC